MESIVYEGERTIFGHIGHFLIITALITAFIGAIAFFLAERKKEESSDLVRFGKQLFYLHALSIVGILGIIFYLMATKSYEYYYVWQHVSDDLPLKYVLSAFWEGQEGSFLLWLFWHAILGIGIIFLEKKYTAPVLFVLCLIQVILMTMILGIYIGDTRVGINPFVLLRNEVDAPIFAQADYLSLINGNGLNPLLQNYWMTIHPPTLFLGFALMAIPFAYAYAGLVRNEHKDWIRAVIPWSLLAAIFLGLGILMGGVWAYEALSFGGYWAWDPVENMSLVPWLILVAGIHTGLIARATGHAIKSTYVYFWLAFVLIIYSTFLTRSGILGDTSVHAFTELGLEWQLVLFLFFFLFFGLYHIAVHWKNIPTPLQEEKTWTREFWMYLGTLTLLFSTLLISFTTSIPVYNKILDGLAYLSGKNLSSWHRTVPTDVVGHHNRYQLWVGIFIVLFSMISLFLKYKLEPSATQLRKIWVGGGFAVLSSLLLALLTAGSFNAYAWQYKFLLFAAYLGILSNIVLFILNRKSYGQYAASLTAHFGFGLLLLGIISTGLLKSYISTNRFAMDGLLENQSDQSLGQNITLLKGVPMYMSGYEVTYTRDSLDGIYRDFEVVFKKLGQDGTYTDSFKVRPNILYDRAMTKVAASNPSTKKYLTKDIFTHVHSLPPEQVNIELAKEKEDSLRYIKYELKLGDTIFLTDGVYGILNYVGRNTSHPDYKADADDYLGSVQITFYRLDSKESGSVSPFVLFEEGIMISFPHQLNPFRLKARLDERSLIPLFYQTPSDPLELVKLELNQGTAIWKNFKIKLQNIEPNAKHPLYAPEEGDLSILIELELIDTLTGSIFNYYPAYVVRDSRVISYDYYRDEQQLLIGIHRLDPEQGFLEIKLIEKDLQNLNLEVEIAEQSGRNDFIVLEAIVFPGINLVWAGSLLMLFGFAISLITRRKFKNGEN